MKLKVFVFLMEKLLQAQRGKDEPTADMYLPLWLFAFSIALAAITVIGAIVFAFTYNIVWIVIAVISLLFSVGAALCWRNQSIVIIDDDTFCYTTFLGNKKTYKFKDIRALRTNRDSLTLFVGDGKVHIESTAILSERLMDKVNSVLAELYNENK